MLILVFVAWWWNSYGVELEIERSQARLTVLPQSSNDWASYLINVYLWTWKYAVIVLACS